MNQYHLIFEKQRHTAIGRRAGPEPEANELFVANHLSAISAGTQMFLFSGHFPEQRAVDTKIASMTGVFRYPLAYGYSSVGEVIAAGNHDNVDDPFKAREQHHLLSDPGAPAPSVETFTE